MAAQLGALGQCLSHDYRYQFHCMNRPRAGMGLLYYGQNALIYPSAFPAGARKSASNICPLALSVLTDMRDALVHHSYSMARRPRSVRLFDSVYEP